MAVKMGLASFLSSQIQLSEMVEVFLFKRCRNVTCKHLLPVDFLSIFIHHPQSLMDFLEKYTNKVKDSPAQVEIHNTLLELYISNELNFPSMSRLKV